MNDHLEDLQLRCIDPRYQVDTDQGKLLSLLISYYDRVSMVNSRWKSDDDEDSDIDLIDEEDLDPNLIDEELICDDISDTTSNDTDSDSDQVFNGKVFFSHDRDYDYETINDQETINNREIRKQVLGLGLDTDTDTGLDEFVNEDDNTGLRIRRSKPVFPIFSNDSSVDPSTYGSDDDSVVIFSVSSESTEPDDITKPADRTKPGCTNRGILKGLHDDNILERVLQLGDSYVVNNHKATLREYISNIELIADTDCDDCIPVIDCGLPAAHKLASDNTITDCSVNTDPIIETISTDAVLTRETIPIETDSTSEIIPTIETSSTIEISPSTETISKTVSTIEIVSTIETVFSNKPVLTTDTDADSTNDTDYASVFPLDAV